MTTQSSTAAARRSPSRSRPRLLRAALLTDAVVSGLNALAYLAAATVLADLFDADTGTLRWLGAFLVLYAVAVWFVGSRPAISRLGAGLVIAANGAWVLASIAAAVTQWGDPSDVGTAWILVQAAAVAVLGVAEFAGLRAGRRGV
ncbi:MAG: hypothetical protein ACR2JK_06160 [Geodermatophilaceae bacterium]